MPDRLAILVLIALLAPASALAADAVAPDEAQTVKSALAHCLDGSHGQIPLASDPTTIPPGLIEGQNVNVVPLPGASGLAFSYEGTGKNVISCGIAVYGSLPASLLMEIRQLIDGHPRWMPSSPDAYTVSGVPADRQYWGNGFSGVLMLTREPGPSAPTLEVEYHSILVH